MKKISDIFGKEIDLIGKCLGCEIINKNVNPPFGILHETANFIVIQDIETPIPGFMVINCKKHIHSILDLSKVEYDELMQLCFKTRQAMSKIIEIVDVTIIQKELAPHFHLWLFPRYNWMINNSELELGYGELADFTKIIKYTRKNCKTSEQTRKIEEYFNIIKDNFQSLQEIF